MTSSEQFMAMSDADLVGYVARGSSPDEQQDAFAAIYQRHSSAVLSYCGGKLNDPDGALDTAAETFTVAWQTLTADSPPRAPEKLRNWLYGIALNRCREVWRSRGRQGEMPDGDIEDDSYERASRARRAEVDRILDVVATTFSPSQHEVFQLSTRQGLVGQKLADTLGKPRKYADKVTFENITLAWAGFGAYILARDGRSYCAELVSILDEYAWNGRDESFTRVLRLRVIRHLDTCKTCENCLTCNTQRDRLIAPYAPALIPALLLSQLGTRVMRGTRATTPASHPQEPPDDDDPPGRPRSRLGRRALAAAGAALLLVAAIILVKTLGGTAHGRTLAAQTATTTYVAGGSASTETVRSLDTATGTLSAPVMTTGRVTALTVAPDGKTLYVTSPSTTSNGAGTVTPVNIATRAVGSPIQFGGGDGPQYATAITPDGKTIYVTGGNYGLYGGQSPGTVTPIDVVAHTAGTQIQVPDGAVAIAMAPDGETVYVTSSTTNSGSGEVTPISTASHAVGQPIKVPGNPLAIAVAPNGRTAYVAVSHGSGTSASFAVVPVNLATGAAGVSIAVPAGTTGIAIAANGRTAYVISSTTGSAVSEVTPINLTSDQAGTAIKIGENVSAIDTKPEGGSAAATTPGQQR